MKTSFCPFAALRPAFTGVRVFAFTRNLNLCKLLRINRLTQFAFDVRRLHRLAFTLVFTFTGSTLGSDRDWPVYLGDAASSHYSDLRQINRKNVHQLEVAWTHHAGDGRSDNRSQIQCNPIIVDGILYGTSPQLKLVAADASNGKEVWRFDAFSQTNAATGVNRGVVFWKDGKDRRILFT